MKNKITAVMDYDMVGYPCESVFEDYANDIDFMIMETRDWCGSNDKLLKEIKTTLEDYDCYGLQGYDTLSEYLNSELPKENKKKWSNKEIAKFRKRSRNFYYCNRYEENGLICDILNIIKEKEYCLRTLRGCCQGESIDIFIPKTYENNDRLLEDLEGLYFGYGCEVVFTDKELENIEDIFEDFDAGRFYINCWNVNTIKEEIAKCYDNCTIEDVKLFEMKPYQITRYNYEEKL